MEKFNYKEAFKRNIGLLTEEEQNKLKEFVIAIPGMGGVGGSDLIALVRLVILSLKCPNPILQKLHNAPLTIPVV